MRSLVWVLVSVTACSFDASGVGGSDAPPGGPPDAPAIVDGMFDAGTCGMCMGNTLKGCNGDPDTQCDLGCSMAGGAHCKQIVPSNGVPVTELNGVTAALVTVGAAAINSKREYTIDTDTGEIDDYGENGFPAGTATVIRAAGTGVRNGMSFDMVGAVSVLGVDSMHIAGDSTLYGFGTHPLVILSRNDVLIEGEIDFSAGCYVSGIYDATCAGPGGGSGASGASAATGCGPGGNGAAGNGASGKFTGGGGGGMATNGGKGADVSGVKGGPAGKAMTCPGPTLDPIAGGGGGGSGGAGQGGEGGGGGGAVQLTSLTQITVSHPAGASNDTDVFVGGAGGSGTPVSDHGGGGGGAGGAILLEAPMIGVHAILSANGGGGGGGRITGPSADGEFATTTAFQALGGVGDGAGGTVGHGGLGGAAAGNASDGTGGDDGTGGGGGAVGRVRLNTKMGSAPDTSLSTISPAASLGMIVTQ